MKSISILGSTGSIGTQTLDVVKSNAESLKVVGLSCFGNVSLLKEQILAFKPEAVAVFDAAKADELTDELKGDVPVYKGMAGMKRVGSLDGCGTMVNALVGSIGVEPTVHAISAGKNIALANKETLVTAGQLVMDAVKKKGVSLMPIDSEHSAIFQCLNGEKIDDVNKITLTCSGGPFKDKSLDELKTVGKSDALAHPTWKMGDKITIDSATLMNKGFEVLETHWLYGLDYDKIDVVLHPQSIIHSLVEFHDKSVMAQLGNPDMRIPIQYALSYPSRFNNEGLTALDLLERNELTFRKPDLGTFPCLKFAYEAGKAGGTMAAVMNAANEVAVKGFLDGELSFLGIAAVVKEMMDKHSLINKPSVEEVLGVDKSVKEETQKFIDELD